MVVQGCVKYLAHKSARAVDCLAIPVRDCDRASIMQLSILAVCAACASAFQMPSKISLPKPSQVAPALAAAAVTAHTEMAHAKSVLGVNGALDFGPLAGDQPGGEGTGKALGVNDDSLFFVLFGVTFAVGFAFAQWQSYQDDDEDDFFDGYDSRRVDKELSNRNRV